MKPFRVVTYSLVVLLLPFATAFGQQQQVCGITCPAGASCACIDCRPCNSGGFASFCACFPVSGQITCTVQTGDCVLGKCASCQSVSKTQTCIVYAKCPGNNCGTEGCVSTARTKAVSCSDCKESGLTARNSLIEVTAATSPSLNVEIVSAHAQSDGDLFALPEIELRSSRSSRLVTVVTQAQFISSGGQTNFVLFRNDSWERDRGFLDGFSSVSVPTNLAARAQDLKQVRLMPLYAEYEDGYKAALDAGLGPCLRSEREEYLAKLAKFLAELDPASTPREALTLLHKHNLSSGWLEILLATQGPQNFVRILSAPRQLKP